MKTFYRLQALCVLFLIPAWALAASQVDETRNMPVDGTVSVSNISGEINISTWDRAEIHIKASIGNNQEMDIVENAQGIQITVRHMKDKRHSDESRVTLVIPETANIVADSVSADITITNSLAEKLNIETVSGDIDIEAQVVRAEFSSVSGEVYFRGTAQRLSAESVSGDVLVEAETEEVSISTVSGDGELEASSIRRGKFESVSGALKLTTALETGARMTVGNMSGDVYVWLPKDQSAEYHAQSFSGGIKSRFGTVKNEKYGPGSQLTHASGDAGSYLRVESFSGDIFIGHK